MPKKDVRAHPDTHKSEAAMIYRSSWKYLAAAWGASAQRALSRC
jgi:hypothetical protein